MFQYLESKSGNGNNVRSNQKRKTIGSKIRVIQDAIIRTRPIKYSGEMLLSLNDIACASSSSEQIPDSEKCLKNQLIDYQTSMSNVSILFKPYYYYCTSFRISVIRRWFG